MAARSWPTWNSWERVSALSLTSMIEVRPMLQLSATGRATREASSPSM
ncbi:hypothetical protein [Streptomyces scabiei]